MEEQENDYSLLIFLFFYFIIHTDSSSVKPMSSSSSLLILDVEKGFLKEKDFEEIQKMCPSREEWKEAVVHHRETGRDGVNHRARKAFKCVERRHDFIGHVQRLLMRALLPRLQKEKGFLYCWARGHRGTEWLWYKPGMFFRPHTDFERYVCGGLVPYVCLIGLMDTEEGGETKVASEKYVGGARKNGMLFFPASEMHEAMPVIKGEKLCLKMEFFVVRSDPDLLQVEDVENRNHRSISIWSKESIGLFDNYLCSQMSFRAAGGDENGGNDDQKKLFFSAETAKELQELMLAIAEARTKECEMFFPTLSTTFLHDIFVCHYHLRNRYPSQAPQQRSVILGTDEEAWDYMNRQMDLPANSRMMVGLWYKKTGKKTYEFYKTFSRLGMIDARQWGLKNPRFLNSPIDKYCPYSAIRRHAIQHFIYTEDMIQGSEPYFSPETTMMDGTSLPQTIEPMDTTILKTIQPSDRIEKHTRKQGMVKDIVTEMCNDEDCGTISDTYEYYVSFDIQVRWFLCN